jgi:xylose isomerase
VFAVSFPTAVDRFITLWEMAGETLEDSIIREASEALKAGGLVVNSTDVREITEANKELLTLHELIGHRLVQILLGLHKGRTYMV